MTDLQAALSVVIPLAAVFHVWLWRQRRAPVAPPPPPQASTLRFVEPPHVREATRR